MSEPPPPLVSVLIPMYNARAFIEETLASVRAQTYSRIEIIVVDDGSTDGSAEIVADAADVQLLHQSNAGEGAARNTAIDAAQGDYFAFLDADDLWEPTKLERQVTALKANPSLGFALCRIRLFHSGAPENTPGPEAIAKAEQHGAFFPSALIVRRDAFERVGRFDPALHPSSDVDWFMRAKDLGVPFEILPERLLRRRHHADNLTHQRTQLRSVVVSSVLASLRRRRAADSTSSGPGSPSA